MNLRGAIGLFIFSIITYSLPCYCIRNTWLQCTKDIQFFHKWFIMSVPCSSHTPVIGPTVARSQPVISTASIYSLSQIAIIIVVIHSTGIICIISQISLLYILILDLIQIGYKQSSHSMFTEWMIIANRSLQESNTITLVFISRVTLVLIFTYLLIRTIFFI